MRRMRLAAVCGAVVVTAVGGTAPVAGAAGGPRTGLAYHGSVGLSAGLVDVRFRPHNHGPGAVPDSVVWLRWSEPLADRQVLPEGCGRSQERAILCRVGALDAQGVGEPVALRVRLRGAPDEVVLEFGTVRSGGAGDGDRDDGRQRVLVLDTGDTYAF